MLGAAVAANVGLGVRWWLEKRHVYTATHVVTLLGESGDGEPYVVTSWEGRAPLGGVALCEWTNTGVVDVHVIGWAAEWTWAGMHGQEYLHESATIPPGGTVTIQSKVGVTGGE